MSATRVGASPRRVGGDARVTGRQQYVADIHLPGELHARLVTVPVARARIVALKPQTARVTLLESVRQAPALKPGYLLDIPRITNSAWSSEHCIRRTRTT